MARESRLSPDGNRHGELPSLMARGFRVFCAPGGSAFCSSQCMAPARGKDRLERAVSARKREGGNLEQTPTCDAATWLKITDRRLTADIVELGSLGVRCRRSIMTAADCPALIC